MNYVTEAVAMFRYCPIDHNACHASECMAWRWFGYPTDDAWQEAVKRAAAEIGDASLGHKRAAAHVNANREKYGLSTERLGYCGLAGAPK